ncbi:MAG: hypothetical protein K6G42_08215 [Lachnospiraceae bacterium]|nr:hypothetical protein [Lachnospiraceae bacterium]
MNTGAALLPEPFSEKNIDGSPITKTAEGRSLFRTPARPERRVADRRTGVDRRTDQGNVGYVPERRSDADYSRSTEGMAGVAGGYGAPSTPAREPEPAYGGYGAPGAPVPGPEPAYSGYGAPDAPVPEPEPDYGGYRTESTSESDYDGYGTESAAEPEPAYDGYGTESTPEPEYDPERFEPPVDEKPGMIPNPMKMPPVKKKSSLEYDMDDVSDYGGYDDPVEETGSDGSGDDYGYGRSFGGDEDRSDGYDYGDTSGQKTEDSGSEGSSDDYDTDYGGSGGYDDDYGLDYESGSDLASDYY